MSDIPPRDGRLGGLVDLSRARSVLPNPTATGDDVTLQPTLAGNEVGANGQPLNLRPEDLIVPGEEDFVNVPDGQGGFQPINVNDLSGQQLQELQALLAQNAPGARNPLPNNGSVTRSVSAILSGRLGDIENPLQNPFPANPLEPLQNRVRSRIGELEQQNEAQVQELNAVTARLGPSHPEIGGRRLYDQEFNPNSLNRSTFSNDIRVTSEDWFAEELAQLNTQGRAVEARIRNAMLDLRGFLDTDDGSAASVAEVTALLESYQQRLDQVRDVRTAYAEDLQIRRAAVAAGDYSALPDAISLSQADAERLEVEFEEEQFTRSSFERLRQVASSTSYQDRTVVELVRGALNGTYTPGDINAQLNRDDPSAEVAEGEFRPRLFSRGEREVMAELISEILGVDGELFESDDSRPSFNTSYLSERQLEFLDTLVLGERESVSGFFETDDIGDRQIVSRDVINRALAQSSQLTDAELAESESAPRVISPANGEPGQFAIFDPRSIE